MSVPILIYICMVCWLVYGNILFYSDDNNCADIEETKGMNALFAFFILVGYVQMMICLLIMCVAPFLVVFILRVMNENRDLNNQEIDIVTQSLQAANFNPDIHKDLQTECHICLCDFEKDE